MLSFWGLCAKIGVLGRRQVVRHRVLVPTFAGSNPADPAKKMFRASVRSVFLYTYWYGCFSPSFLTRYLPG